MVGRTRSVHLAILATAFLVQSAYAQAIIGGDWRSDVDRFADELVEMGAAPGIGLAIVQNDWVLHARGFGVADMDAGRGVDTETAFYIASSSKAITATAVIALADRGLLDLHAPITAYVPELRFRPPLDADSVTIHDLLTMTHGIQQELGPVVFRTAFTGDFTRAQLIDAMHDYGPSSTGRRFAYGEPRLQPARDGSREHEFRELEGSRAAGSARPVRHGSDDRVRVADPPGAPRAAARLPA